MKSKRLGNNRELNDSNRLSYTRPELVRFWSKRNEITPDDVTGCSGVEVWWSCENGHEWKRAPNYQRSACPTCSLADGRRGYHRKWGDEEIEALKRIYSDHDKYTMMASFPNRTWPAISLAAHKLGLRRNDPSKGLRESKVERLLEDKPEAYYWAGFLAADGYISEGFRLKVTLAEVDRNHMEKLSRFLCAKIRTETAHNPTRKVITITAMHKSALADFCRKYGWSNRKTYHPLKIPLDGNSLIAFIVGFIDGDGCIRKQCGRRDALLRVKCHSSWFENMRFMEDKLYSILGVNKSRYGEDKTFTRIDARGYASLIITNNHLLCELKRRAVLLNLPIMSRKWDNIELEYDRGDVYRLLEERVSIIKGMLSDGKSILDISKTLGMEYHACYMFVRRRCT